MCASIRVHTSALIWSSFLGEPVLKEILHPAILRFQSDVLRAADVEFIMQGLVPPSLFAVLPARAVPSEPQGGLEDLQQGRQGLRLLD
jgi:hypothetical protein